jgi:hypothetical protein
LGFLKEIDRETPKDLDLHLIADNYATHRHPKVRPGSQDIRAGSFTSVKELVDDINAFAERNANPKPYKWTSKMRRS